MSALEIPEVGHPFLDHLTQTSQLREWAQRLAHGDGGRVRVAHSRDRRMAAVTLAAASKAVPVPLDNLGATRLTRGDLLIVIVSPESAAHDSPCVPGTVIDTLHGWMRAGVEIWSITGPRPNSVADHSHDSLAIPFSEPEIVSRGHELAVQTLVRPPGARLRAVAGSARSVR